MAEAYWLFIEPALSRTTEMPKDSSELPFVLEFFRRAAPPVAPSDKRNLCWTPQAAIAGRLPLGRVHQTVRIRGLVAKPHFNGLTGLVEGIHGDNGRVMVSLHCPLNDTQGLTLKPKNLEVLPWPPLTASAIQFALDMMGWPDRRGNELLLGTDTAALMRCLAVAGVRMQEELYEVIGANMARVKSWHMSTADLNSLGIYAPPAGHNQDRHTLIHLTAGLREAGNGWLLMRLLMCADHHRLLCHLGGDSEMSRLWAVHRDWVRHAWRQPAILSEIILRGASPDTMAEYQRLFFRPDTPPLVRWFAGHPHTTLSLPTLVPPSGDARRPPAPGRFNEDPDAEQRLASMCGAAMLLKYHIVQPMGPIHRTRSEFASSWGEGFDHLYLTAAVHYTTCSGFSSSDSSILRSTASSSGTPTSRASRTRSRL